MQDQYPDRTCQDSDRSDDGRRERARCAHRARWLVDPLQAPQQLRAAC